MIKVRFKADAFRKDMDNIVDYSLGFLEGVERGKPGMMDKFSLEIKEAMKEFIDASARVNPRALHHIYEWNQTGSPDARLYNLNCEIRKGGISVYGTFSQSTSIKEGSKTPFYNKAEVMENGIPVKISPVNATVLAFDDNGEQVFTRGSVTVENPGGRETYGSFEKVFDQFFTQYFTQAFILSSRIMNHLSVPQEYVNSLSKSKTGGRAAGIAAGYRWVTMAGGIK